MDILSANSFYNQTTSSGEATTTLGLATPAAVGGAAAAAEVAKNGGTLGDAASLAAGNAAGAAYGAALTAFWPGTDVVRIAVPTLQTSKLLNISVASITMGTNGVQNGTNPSFGSFALNNINLAGTTAYIWAH